MYWIYAVIAAAIIVQIALTAIAIFESVRLRSDISNALREIDKISASRESRKIDSLREYQDRQKS